MTPDLFSNKTLEQIHWISLYLGLPPGGIDAAFPSEDACEARLFEVRWPDGPVCPTCFQTNAHFLDLRKIQTCRKCKKQFSLTSGTDLHRIHLGLKAYFELAEEIIQYRQRGAMPTLRQLQDKHDMAYATAIRLRSKLTENLAKFHGGLLGRCICSDFPSLPPDMVFGSESHLLHLQGEMQRRRWQALGNE
ncbi:transposase [Pseudosulfitobacter koreensis]|uniref:Transposase n=1 Tax=Pseudosulfitobacter koreensis TaxID=2968472 RepID=A0ABT1YWI6_9RHOB|nr:transposase [Pseudosulfitobacter koreense]MCR8825241.1 transposase [Pseudosulfitobacter koreense]